ncbi:MAG: DinB family protein [Gemmatimonadaceae bacterium]|nr:DinB family protein [Gemmatimonadaceae bacterium]
MSATVNELYADLDLELAATRRVLERVPFEHWDWKPHPKSFSLGRLATHLAELPRFAEVIATTDEMDMAKSPMPPSQVGSNADLLARFDERAATMRSVVAAMDEDALAGHWTLRVGDTVFLDAPRSLLLRQHGISHPIHHRAQLTVYLRLLDVPVPGLYGPSADDV